MAVLKEWVCAAHGSFDSTEQRCPHGCSARFVKREFRTAPTIGNVRNGNRDRIERDLAGSFGLTNMTNHQGDLSVMQGLRRLNWAEYNDPNKGYAPSFALDVPHAAPGWTQRGEEAPVYNPAAAGFSPDTQVKPKQFSPPKAEIAKDGKGRPMSYRAPIPKVDA